MTLAESAFLWVGTFAQVFLMGLQSRNVQGGHYIPAAVTSLFIGAAQLAFVRGAVSGSPLEVLAIVGTAGPAGICFAIYAWGQVARRARKRAT